jgi:3-oxoacyl-[acyl-carrier protein] reductase
MRTQPAPRVVITGGTGSLGRVIAGKLRECGWSVDAPGRNELDVASLDSVTDFFGKRETNLLVCNAGITRDALLARMTPATWDRVWEVNYRGALRCIRAVLPAMEARQSGHVILIGSHSAFHPPAGQAAYAASKAALIGLMDDLAAGCGASGIRINAILPGFLETRMTADVSPVRVVGIRADHSLGRFNTCREVAAFVRFLHEELPHTSGQLFQLDSRPR